MADFMDFHQFYELDFYQYKLLLLHQSGDKQPRDLNEAEFENISWSLLSYSPY